MFLLYFSFWCDLRRWLGVKYYYSVVPFCLVGGEMVKTVFILQTLEQIGDKIIGISLNGSILNGNRPKGNRPNGNKPDGNRPNTNIPNGNRPDRGNPGDCMRIETLKARPSLFLTKYITQNVSLSILPVHGCAVIYLSSLPLLFSHLESSPSHLCQRWRTYRPTSQ